MPASRAIVLRRVALTALAWFGVHCGPSFEVRHESHVRFERCYAQDEDGHVTFAAKAQCWREYGARFGEENQDKKRYAEMRAATLTQLGSLPTDDALMRAAPGSTEVHVAAPAPLSAENPPVRTAR